MQRGDKGKRVVRFTKRLAYIHKPDGSKFLKRWWWTYKAPVAEAVEQFQRHYKLEVDGKIGPETGHKINAVFKRQWNQRGKK